MRLVLTHANVIDGINPEPLADIHHLRQLLLVLKEGRVVADKRAVH